MSREMYKRVAPHIDRVRYDGGVATDNMNELLLLQRSNEGLKDYIKLAFCPELYGNKIRTSGANNFITKSYSKEDVGNNLTQTSSANQPYLDKIAPSEKLSAKNPNGGSNYLTHPTISFGASDSWSVEFTICVFGGENFSSIFGDLGEFHLKEIEGNSFNSLIQLGSGRLFNTGFDWKKYVGKNIVCHITYKNGLIYCYLNGIQTNTGQVPSMAINFIYLFVGYVGRFSKSKISSYHIFSKDLSASEVSERSAILRSIFPEIPFTRIGDQIWSVRNFEAAVTPQGNLIPEVQSNTTWATSQTLYDNAYNAAGGAGGGTAAIYAGVKAAAMWSHYNNDPALGAVYGKLYNWFAVKLLQMDIDYYNANNPTTPWGWRVPTQSDFNTLATTLGGAAVAGGKMKTVGTTYWNSPNTGADNSSGFSIIGASNRDESGIAWNMKGNSLIAGLDSYMEIKANTSSSGFVAINNSNMRIFGYSIRLIKA